MITQKKCNNTFEKAESSEQRERERVRGYRGKEGGITNSGPKLLNAK